LEHRPLYFDSHTPPPLAVKLQPDSTEGLNAVHSLLLHEVRINTQSFDHSVIVPWKGLITPWPISNFDDLSAEHFSSLIALKPELVIFGSGPKLRFPSPALLRLLIESRIGIETMDNGAACRTYNVLVAEGRSAVLALLMPKEALI
jgi:uncharacterized protein